jgi:outer membrane protein
MKNILTLLFFATLTLTTSIQLTAQRIAVVDINALLQDMDDYKAAQAELDRVADAWRQEIAQEYDKIKGMYNRYQAEQVLLSDEARAEREEEIVDAETRVREMQKNRFGPEGELFQRRSELVQPIQDKVYSAIQTYADKRGYDFIFDKGSASGLLFSKPSFDKTEEVKTTLETGN